MNRIKDFGTHKIRLFGLPKNSFATDKGTFKIPNMKYVPDF